MTAVETECAAVLRTKSAFVGLLWDGLLRNVGSEKEKVYRVGFNPHSRTKVHCYDPHLPPYLSPNPAGLRFVVSVQMRE